MSDLISVVLPTHNRAHLLPRCMKGILNQTYNNIELIIVDDGSEDDTAHVVEQYIKKNDNIKYYRHEIPKGLSASRNTGISKANGTYIAVMDDDDEWIDNEKLSKQINIFLHSKNERLAIVFTNVFFYEDGKDVHSNIEIPEDIKQKLMWNNCIISSPTVLVRKDLLEKVGGYDEEIFRGVDSDLYRNMIVKHGYDLYYLNDVTTIVYRHNGSRIMLMEHKKDLERWISSLQRTLSKYHDLYNKYPVSRIFYGHDLCKSVWKYMVKYKSLSYTHLLIKYLFNEVMYYSLRLKSKITRKKILE